MIYILFNFIVMNNLLFLNKGIKNNTFCTLLEGISLLLVYTYTSYCVRKAFHINTHITFKGNVRSWQITRRYLGHESGPWRAPAPGARSTHALLSFIRTVNMTDNDNMHALILEHVSVLL